MKRFWGFLAFAIVGMCVQATAVTAAGPENPYCYESVQRTGYMDCMHPVPSGHVSCIPYASNCSVGAQCGQALQQFHVTPDGSFLNSMLLDTELAADAATDSDMLFLASGAGEEHTVNCLGLVSARRYSVARALEIERQTKEIVL